MGDGAEPDDGGDARPMKGGGRRSQQLHFGTAPRPRGTTAPAERVMLAHRDEVAVSLDVPSATRRALDALVAARQDAAREAYDGALDLEHATAVARAVGTRAWVPATPSSRSRDHAYVPGPPIGAPRATPAAQPGPGAIAALRHDVYGGYEALFRQRDYERRLRWRFAQPASAVTARPARHVTKPMLEKYVGEHEAESGIWRGRVRYLDEGEREAQRVRFVDGRLHWADGTRVDTATARSAFKGGVGRAIFVMDERGEIYASTFHEAGVFHHSSLLGGAPAAAAGELEVSDGVLTLVTDRSGHYRPDADHMLQLFAELEERGVPLDAVHYAPGFGDEASLSPRRFAEQHLQALARAASGPAGAAASGERPDDASTTATLASISPIAEPARAGKHDGPSGHDAGETSAGDGDRYAATLAGAEPPRAPSGERDLAAIGAGGRADVAPEGSSSDPRASAPATPDAPRGERGGEGGEAPRELPRLDARPGAGRGRPTGWTRFVRAFGRKPESSRVPVEACQVCGSLSCGTARAEKGWLKKLLRSPAERAADALHRRRVRFDRANAFDDRSVVPGSKRKLGDGTNVNAVYRMLYDDRTGKTHVVFYKPPADDPQGNTAVFRWTGKDTYRLAARAVMSYQLGKALGLDVLSREVFATHVNDAGELETGNASFGVGGEAMKADLGIDEEKTAELLTKVEKGFKAKVTTVEMRTDLPITTPEAQRSLTDLQALDWLTMQTDRHPGNIHMEASGRAWGIDNDLALGPDMGPRDFNRGIPPMVHEDTAKAVLAMTEEELEAVLDRGIPESEQLTRGEGNAKKNLKSELEAAKQRLRMFQAQLRDGRTRIVKGFDDASFATLREAPDNYIGAYVATLRQIDASPALEVGPDIFENGKAVGETRVWNTLQGGALPEWAMKADDPRRQVHESADPDEAAPHDPHYENDASRGTRPENDGSQGTPYEDGPSQNSRDDDGNVTSRGTRHENADEDGDEPPPLELIDDADRELISGSGEDAGEVGGGHHLDATSSADSRAEAPEVGRKAIPKGVQSDSAAATRTLVETERDACPVCGSLSCNSAQAQKSLITRAGKWLKKSVLKDIRWRAGGGRGRRPLDDGDVTELRVRRREPLRTAHRCSLCIDDRRLPCGHVHTQRGGVSDLQGAARSGQPRRGAPPGAR